MFSDVGAWLDVTCHVSQCSLWCLQGILFLFEFTTVQCSASLSTVFIKPGDGRGEKKEMEFIYWAPAMCQLVLSTLCILYFIFKIISWSSIYCAHRWRSWIHMVKWLAPGHKNQVTETHTASYIPSYDGGNWGLGHLLKLSAPVNGWANGLSSQGFTAGRALVLWGLDCTTLEDAVSYQHLHTAPDLNRILFMAAIKLSPSLLPPFGLRN